MAVEARLDFRIPIEDRDALKRIAEIKGLKLSTCARDAISKWIAMNEVNSGKSTKKIVLFIEERGSVFGEEIAEEFKLQRSYIDPLLDELITLGKITSEWDTERFDFKYFPVVKESS